MQIELQKHIASLSSEEFEGFLSNINMIPLLTIEEEIELIRRIRKGGSVAERAMELLVKTNLRYIYIQLQRDMRIHISVSRNFSSLASPGSFGLLESLMRHVVSHSFRMRYGGLDKVCSTLYLSVVLRTSELRQSSSSPIENLYTIQRMRI